MKPNAVLVKVRKDGAQGYRVEATDALVWLQGLDRCPGVEVGDRGALVFENSASRGYFRFVPESAKR